MDLVRLACGIYVVKEVFGIVVRVSAIILNMISDK